MSHYKHLTLSEREKLMYFLAKGYSMRRIARELGRSASTISRELKRNTSKGEYLPVKAEARYHKRRKKCRREKLLTNIRLYALVWDKFLNHQWSPEQIAGRLKLENYPYQISYRTIYRAIYSGMFDVSRKREPDGVHTAKRKLRHKGKPRRGKDYVEKRGQLTIPHTILERPEAAETRSRLGDWEADTVLGGKKGPCLLTLVDRRSRLLICRKLSRRSSKELAEAAIQALQDHPLETITPDRGTEFRYHERVTEGLGGVQFYFSLPHHPWQRGTNENTNGLLREYFPKGQDLTDVTQEAVQRVEDELNHRPRKILGYKTPAEIHFSILLHLT